LIVASTRACNAPWSIDFRPDPGAGVDAPVDTPVDAAGAGGIVGGSFAGALQPALIRASTVTAVAIAVGADGRACAL